MRYTRTLVLLICSLVFIAMPVRGVALAVDTVAVSRLAGADRAATAAALAAATTSSPQEIFVVASTDFADGLAAGAAAAVSDGVVALVHPDSIPQPTRDLVVQYPNARVTVVGGTGRLPMMLETALRSDSGRQTIRISGADRYATAAALATRTFPDGATEVWIVSGTSAADALSAGAAAAASGGALLTTAASALPDATAAALRQLGPARVTVVGGASAVSDVVLSQIAGLVPTADVRRIGAADRYATSAAVAAAAFSNPPAAVLTTGRAWADALAATPLAAQMSGPVLLVPRRCVTAAVGSQLASVGRVVIAGGEVAVSPRVESLSPCADEIAAVSPAAMGSSWRPGCPVAAEDLRHVTVDYHALDGSGVQVGELVVHRDVAGQMVATFDRLFDDRFGFERVTTVAVYGSDDQRAMAANATTAFNCRTVAGTPRWSEHAYGTAIDINPVQNPYVSGATVEPDAGTAYLNRPNVRPGMVTAGGPVTRAFADIGWGWGGNWRSVKDYQHFSASGR